MAVLLHPPVEKDLQSPICAAHWLEAAAVFKGVLLFSLAQQQCIWMIQERREDLRQRTSYSPFYYKKRRSLFCCLDYSQEAGVEVESFVDASIFQVNTFISSAFKTTIISAHGVMCMWWLDLFCFLFFLTVKCLFMPSYQLLPNLLYIVLVHWAARVEEREREMGAPLSEAAWQSRQEIQHSD